MPARIGPIPRSSTVKLVPGLGVAVSGDDGGGVVVAPPARDGGGGGVVLSMVVIPRTLSLAATVSAAFSVFTAQPAVTSNTNKALLYFRIRFVGFLIQ